MELKNICFSYGKKVVYDNLNLSVPDKKITCVLGPSGCGKTTLLNMIGGVLPYSGIIEGKGSVAYIFQQPCLIPSMTVIKNVEFVLKSVIKNRKEHKEKAEEILKAVGLSEEANNYPKQLSGGMAQRVSLARAFCYPADVLLMDEPFKELDISLKKQIYALFTELYEKSPKTTVFVTHDIEEALVFGDKIVVMKEGKVAGEFICDKNSSAEEKNDIKEKILALI